MNNLEKTAVVLAALVGIGLYLDHKAWNSIGTSKDTEK